MRVRHEDPICPICISDVLDGHAVGVVLLLEESKSQAVKDKYIVMFPRMGAGVDLKGENTLTAAEFIMIASRIPFLAEHPLLS